MVMKFEIDEIATVVNNTNRPEANGMECKITGINIANSDGIIQDYSIHIPDFPSRSASKDWCINEPFLKKKPKPKAGSWDIVAKATGWNPTKIKEVI